MKRIHYRKLNSGLTLCHRITTLFGGPLLDEDIRNVTCKDCLHRIVQQEQYQSIIHSIWYAKAQDAKLSLKRYANNTEALSAERQ